MTLAVISSTTDSSRRTTPAATDDEIASDAGTDYGIDNLAISTPPETVTTPSRSNTVVSTEPSISGISSGRSTPRAPSIDAERYVLSPRSSLSPPPMHRSLRGASEPPEGHSDPITPPRSNFNFRAGSEPPQRPKPIEDRDSGSESSSTTGTPTRRGTRSETRSAGVGPSRRRDGAIEYLAEDMEDLELQSDIGGESAVGSSASAYWGGLPELMEVETDETLEGFMNARERFKGFLAAAETKVNTATAGREQSALPSFVGWMKRESARLKERCNEGHEIRVAFLGNSGTGKSTLINSLLGKEEIAPSSGEGACTSVLTNYRKTREQDGDFAVEIEFISRDQWMNEAKDIVKAIREFEYMDEKERGSDLGQAVFQAQDSGFKKLQSLFPGLRKQDILHHDMKLIEELTTSLDASARLFGTYQGSAGGLFGQTIYARFDDEETFRDALREISAKDYHLDSEDTFLWPIMSKTNVYVNSPLLINGLVLVDLPGQLDANRARAAIAINALKRCDEILIVAAMRRAQSESTLSEMFQTGIGHQIQQSGLHRLSVVVTQCDDFRGSKADIIKKWRQLAKITKADEKLPLKTLRGRAIRARNESTKRVVKAALLEHLRTTHSDIRRDFKIHVFCVSSYDYEVLSGNRTDALDDHMPRCLTLHDTGIPTLKRHCVDLVNGRLKQKLDNLLRGDCMSFLNNTAALFDDKNQLEGIEASGISSQEVLKAFEDLEKNVDEKVFDVLESFEGPLEELITLAGKCKRKSCAKCGEIIGRRFYHYRTFQATCERDGFFYSRGAAGLINWNSDLLEEYKLLVRAWTERFEKFQEEEFLRKCQKSLLEPFETDILQNRHIRDHDRTRMHQIRTALAKIDDLVQQTDRMTLPIFTPPEGPGSFMAELMSNTYRSCLNVGGGGGVTARLHDALLHGVNANAPRAYARINEEIENNVREDLVPSIREILENETNRMKESVQTVYLERYQELLDKEEARLDRRRNLLRSLETAGLVTSVEEMKTSVLAAFAGQIRI